MTGKEKENRKQLSINHHNKVPDIIARRSSEEFKRTRSSEDFRNTSWKEFGLNKDEVIAWECEIMLD